MMKKIMLVISLCTVMTLKPASYWDTITTMFRAAGHKITAIASAFKSKAISAQQSIIAAYQRLRQTKQVPPVARPEQSQTSKSKVSEEFNLDDWYGDGKTGKMRLKLLQDHPDYKDAKTKDGTPFIIREVMAADKGSRAVVNQLMKSDADVNAIDGKGMTALMHAIKTSGARRFIEVLLEGVATDINIQDADGDTALMMAVSKNDPQVVQQLIEYKNIVADLAIKNRAGKTALDIAAAFLKTSKELSVLTKQEAIVQLLLNALLKHDPAIINAPDDSGDTLLMRAVEAGNMRMVQILVNNKYNARKDLVNKSNKTALEIADAKMIAAPSIHFDHFIYKQIRDMLSEGSKSEAVSNPEEFNLDDWYGHGKTGKMRLELLQDHPDYKDAKTKDGTPFIIREVMAGEQGSRAVVKQLIEFGADVNALDSKGMTALMHAIIVEGANKFIKTLLSSKTININIQDTDGDTALMMAASRRDSAAIRSLLNNNKIDFTLKNKANHTVLDIAEAALKDETDPFAMGRSVVIFSDLLKAIHNNDKSIINKKDDNTGQTLLMRMVTIGNEGLVKLLLEGYSADKSLTNKNHKTALEIAEAAKKIIPETDIEKHKAYENIINLLK
ncbi:MAG: ankyrin repeat domain-containing protein [Candidatus Babeliaceae bacterium]|jgi:ankyrin repeat protein